MVFQRCLFVLIALLSVFFVFQKAATLYFIIQLFLFVLLKTKLKPNRSLFFNVSIKKYSNVNKTLGLLHYSFPSSLSVCSVQCKYTECCHERLNQPGSFISFQRYRLFFSFSFFKLICVLYLFVKAATFFLNVFSQLLKSKVVDVSQVLNLSTQVVPKRCRNIIQTTGQSGAE